VLARFGQAELAWLAALLTVPPYLLVGWITSSTYQRFSDRAAILYGADLFGATVGLAGGLLLVGITGPFTALLAVAGLAALAALAFGLPARWALLMPVVIALAPINAFSNLVRFDASSISDAAPDKTLIHVLRNPDLQAKHLETRPSAVAQVDVVSVDDDERRFVFNDAGAGSIMLPVGFDDTKLEAETAFLPFTTGANAKTLVIGAGAGFDVRMARHAGSSDITAVEINPAMVQLTRDQTAYNGGILDAPGVQTVIDDGRHFVERSTKNFDLIFLNLVYSQAAAPSSATLNENFAFTTQAFQAYWRNLGQDGRLGIVAHNGVEGVKLLLTALQALEMEGIPLTQALGHVALVMTNPGDDPEAAPSVLVLRRTPWTTAQSDQFAQQVIARELKALYIPHEFEFTLGVLKNGKMDLGQYLAANPQFELRPTSDDRPFFYQLEPGVPQALLVLAGVGVALLLGLIVFALTRQDPREARASDWRFIVFFTLTGLAFILAEIALLKRFGLLLGQPTLTLAVVIGGLLLGGTVGSLLTHRIHLEHRRSMVIIGLLVAAMLTTFALTSSWLVHLTLPLELPIRAIVLLMLLTLLGIPMAMFFPDAIERANTTHSRLIPAFWGINAIAGGLGSVAATLIALQIGFGPVLVLAAALYAMVGLLLP
jgi:hypothetical protein